MEQWSLRAMMVVSQQDPVRDRPASVHHLLRAMITLEGSLTTLCPGYLFIDAAQQVAAEWAGTSWCLPTSRTSPVVEPS